MPLASHLDRAEGSLLDDLLLRGLQFVERFLQLAISRNQILLGLLAPGWVLDGACLQFSRPVWKDLGHEQAGGERRKATKPNAMIFQRNACSSRIEAASG